MDLNEIVIVAASAVSAATTYLVLYRQRTKLSKTKSLPERPLTPVTPISTHPLSKAKPSQEPSIEMLVSLIREQAQKQELIEQLASELVTKAAGSIDQMTKAIGTFRADTSNKLRRIQEQLEQLQKDRLEPKPPRR
jgi:hypothetical protein